MAAHCATPKGDGKGSAGKGGKGFSGKGYGKGGKGEGKGEGKGKGGGKGGKGPRPWCDHCGKSGHTAESCWTKYPDQLPWKNAGAVDWENPEIEQDIGGMEVFKFNEWDMGGMEVLNDDEWGVIRTFQTTKLEDKVGLDAKIDMIRSHLNKMTDKNYIDMRNKIIDIIDSIIVDNVGPDDMTRVSSILFEIASTNRFFSKIYADLYSVLITKYDDMKSVFEVSLNKFTELFASVEYVESTVDYDKFCRINKDNEKRKALSAFFVNLMNNNIIATEKIVDITRNLLCQLYSLITVDNKKNEVDELTENIALLYKKDLYNIVKYDLIEGMTIPQLIDKLAHCKSKDYKSFTNKAIFKFMDLIEM